MSAPIIGNGPLATLARERATIRLSLESPGQEMEDDPRFVRFNAIDEEIIATPAATMSEVIAKLRVAQDDFWQFHFDAEQEPDQGERLVLAALDDALRLLRRCSILTTGKSAAP